MLNSSHPMYVAWGDDLTFLFNDSASLSIGDKQSWAFGRPLAEVWPEIWSDISPIVERALAGESVWVEDQKLIMNRRGYPEETYFTYCYSPIRDETGRVGGIFCAGSETTSRVQAERERATVEAARNKSEERVRLALEASSGIGTWDWDMETDLVYADASLASIFGVSGDTSTAGAPLDEYFSRIHPDDVAQVREDIARALEDSEFRSEYRLVQPDGQIRWVLARGRVHRDADGKPVRLPGAAIDITDRKRVEEELHDSRERLDTIVSQASVGITQTDVSGRIELANDRYCEILGRAREQIIGQWMQSFTHPEDLPDNLTLFRRMLKTDEPFLIEKRYVRPDGSCVWVNCHVSLTHSLNRKPRSVIAVVQDVSQRRLAENALKRLNENLESAVEERTRERDRMWRLSKDVMLVGRIDATILAANPASTALLGYSEDELRDCQFIDFVHPDDRPASLAEVERLQQGLATVRFEHRFRHKDGSYRWLSWTAVPDDELVHAIGRDITQEKEAAAALRQAEEALRQSQKMEAIGQLTGGIAHDFNNLLMGITGSLRLVERRIEAGNYSDIARFLGLAMNSANRAASLTQRLLAFSRRQPLSPKPVKVDELVASIEEILQRTLGESIELELETAGVSWLALCDLNQLESALLNLAINARDAMPAGGKLTISAANVRIDRKTAAGLQDARSGEYVRVSVTDTGVGMSPDVISRAFDPFFTTKPLGQGTGLGLSMIYGFVRQSDGFVQLGSEPGEGTTVALYLPRSTDEDESNGCDAPGSGEAQPPGLGERILVVEDEKTVRQLIVEGLQELGYRTVEAGTGAEGLEILRSTGDSIDLVVSDIGLPDLNGRQMIDAAWVRLPGLKVLFMTGYAENVADSKTFLQPGMEIISKPFEMDALATRVRAMLTRSQAATA